MTIEYRKRITREMLRDEPDKLFVFGDNLERRGLGGQAAEMRNERNAVGIPTKHAPSMHLPDFFSDSDFGKFFERSFVDFQRLVFHTQRGEIIVWPEDGIGTGYAQLEKRAPKIFRYIKFMEELLS